MCPCSRTTPMMASKSVLTDILLSFDMWVLFLSRISSQTMWSRLRHSKSIFCCNKVDQRSHFAFLPYPLNYQAWFFIFFAAFGKLPTIFTIAHNFQTHKDFCLKFGGNTSNWFL